VKLDLDRDDIAELLSAARSAHDGMLADVKTFPNPNPTLVILQAQTTALDTAQQATKARTKGTAAARDLARDALWTSMESQRMYVQTIIDQNPERAATIVAAVSMHLVDAHFFVKPLLGAEQAHDGSPVALHANATLLREGKRKGQGITYHWRHSLDRGQTWVNDESTPLAETEIAGLPADTEVHFQVKVTIGKETGEWSQSVVLKVR
jgi:hypothetical protein